MPEPVVIYGIKNCGTMKKARTWLDANGVAYRFHDFKVEGIAKTRVEGWAKQAGWEVLLNRAGTTFRRLPRGDQANLTQSRAITLMVSQPSMIKRPVLEFGGQLQVGFRAERYRELFIP